LGVACGTGVTGTIFTTTILLFFIARHGWVLPLWLVLAGGSFFLVIELAFFASNLTKVFHGAWLPIIFGVVFFTVMITWYRGREPVTAARKPEEGAPEAV